MNFQLAYELPIKVGREVVFIQSDNWHHKVRVMVVQADEAGDSVTLIGHSYGSSFRGIKAAKKDETPVIVRGKFERTENGWSGSLVSV